VVMVEGGCDIVSESDMLEAIFFGHQALQPLIDLQVKLKEINGVPKRPFAVLEKDEELVKKVEQDAHSRLYEAIQVSGKKQRNVAIRNAKFEIMEKLGDDFSDRKDEIFDVLDDIIRKISRDIILKEGRRIDNRKFDEIRAITCEVNILPRTHGSALFTRGETQVLGVLTLGSGGDEQRVETLSGDEYRPFMLHYNFPPFSVGEVRRLGGPSRRDIGHGGLSTRAIEKVLPPREAFDYTIRIVSEVFESNGSSSMGTVCAGILALMDGGVPITAPVSGIAMGLVKEGDQIAILSDILGDEDHSGDMDFKVAGTKDGITALQMDIKIHELSKDIPIRSVKSSALVEK
jgi:polyribonucleotide nucleotidyltransferase